MAFFDKKTGSNLCDRCRHANFMPHTKEHHGFYRCNYQIPDDAQKFVAMMYGPPNATIDQFHGVTRFMRLAHNDYKRGCCPGSCHVFAKKDKIVKTKKAVKK